MSSKYLTKGMRPDADTIVKSLHGDYYHVSGTRQNMLPSLLFHYTSAAGLLGIVTSRVLRASNFAYLNDSTEIRYGESVVREILAKHVADATGLAKDALGVTLQVIERLTADIEFYLTCFCTESDLLSQWRGYGTASGRFCVAFDCDKLFNQTPSLKHRLKKVIYDRKTQDAKIMAVIDRAKVALGEAVALNATQQKDCVKRICSELFEKLIWELCFFKHPGFAEEKEWRAVHWMEDTAQMKFEARGGTIRPFVEMFNSGQPSPLPIAEVIVGSSIIGSPTKKTVELLLEACHYQAVKVRESGVPFRDV